MTTPPTLAPVFANWLGAPRPAEILTREAASGRPAHAYLFTGAEGTGKATAALWFAAALLCPTHGCGACAVCRRVLAGQHPDCHPTGPDKKTSFGIDHVRDNVIRAAALQPFEATRKVFILDGAGMLTAPAANALLKTLEEPPGGTVLILVAESLAGVLPTVISRCRVVRFPPLPYEAIVQALTARGAAVPGAERAARQAMGSLGRAQTLLRRQGGQFAAIEDALPQLTAPSLSPAGRALWSHLLGGGREHAQEATAYALALLHREWRAALDAGEPRAAALETRLNTLQTLQRTLDANANPGLAADAAVASL